ncbi:HPr family phosphocarrier protein [Metabacillus sp. GX 13764]|uniref:HPr family phosphocarrier protein n=1 Tax=Metabacillus kandeliae TaxID=2900151 RepID=UPI001E54AAF6|nr:HPr family phosphocarrier protein [Metabacillus kandeliae]MCD7033268.1 HPr family phosphocarrier protein [Metabacillus kandeliae]
MKVRAVTPVFAETASKLVEAANRHEERILIKKDHWVIDAKSLLGILALSLQPGDVVEIIDEDSRDKSGPFVEAGLFEKI